MKKGIYLLLFFILLMSLPVFAASEADEQFVSNVQMKQVGKTLVVTYDLSRDAIINLSYRYNDDGTTREQQLFILNRLEEKHVSGDVGYVRAGRNRQIIWDVLEDEESFNHEEVSFVVISRSLYSGSKMGVLGSFGYGFAPKQISGGLTLTYLSKKGFGVYGSFRSNFNFGNDIWATSTATNGNIDWQIPFYSGVTKTSYWVAEAGFLCNLFKDKKSKSMLALGLGVGYGSRRVLWETTDHLWVYNKSVSTEGFDMGFRLIGSIQGLSIMAGVNTLNFKYCEFEVGIGWTFPFRNR